MLEGQYGLATNNISNKEVGSVKSCKTISL